MIISTFLVSLVNWNAKYSRTPVTRTLKGDEKRFELSGVRVFQGKII